jgi:proteic killer suppression protein
MIASFKDEITRKIYDGEKVKRLDRKLREKARRKLQQLHAAIRLEDLYFPPSNMFHALEGHNPRRYAIWINNQWRISFEWTDGKAENVHFEDYH